MITRMSYAMSRTSWLHGGDWATESFSKTTLCGSKPNYNSCAQRSLHVPSNTQESEVQSGSSGSFCKVVLAEDVQRAVHISLLGLA